MATIIPNHRQNEIDFHNSYGEEILYEKFASLPDEYIVFHSINWKEESKFNIRDGETDFLVFHKEYGLLSIEVKDGGIEGKQGDIYQTNRKTNEKVRIDPMFQADKSKFLFIKKLKQLNLSPSENYRIDSLVWFTGVKKNDLNGDLPHSYFINGKTFFSDHLTDVNKALITCFKFYNHQKKEIISKNVKQVVNTLAPEFSLIPSMNNLFEQNNYYFNKMTHEQSYLLDYLEEQDSAVIQGGAGTGKTMIALEKARRISFKNEKVIFLCFNTLLVKSLQIKYSKELKNVDFTNLNAITAKALKKSKIDDNDIEYFLNNIEDYPSIWNYKHIIIDEAQDFSDTSIQLLKEIAQISEGLFYAFYDKNQLVQRRDNLNWLKDMECRLLLSKNCRNTMSIAETSTKPIGIEKLKMKLNITGNKSLYHNCESKASLLEWMEDRIKKYLDNGIKKKQITILTTKTINNSIFNDVNKIGGYRLTQEFDDGNILFTTARKFKGLESDIVFIIDLDSKSFDNDEERRVFYVAASRAKNQLELVSNLDDKEVEKFCLSVTKGRSKRLNSLFKDLKVKII